MYGVDEIILNYKMFMNIKDCVKGIFLFYVYEDYIGVLLYILKELNVFIYVIFFIMEVVKDFLKEKNFDLN